MKDESALIEKMADKIRDVWLPGGNLHDCAKAALAVVREWDKGESYDR